MKKIIVVLFFLAGTLGFTNVVAQEKTTAKKPATSTVKAKDSTLKKTGMKKDGTPDMRLKANKAAKTAPVGPLKKDSTPDMRYKANKAKAKK